MTNYIHPTAVIYPNVLLGENIYIGANCIIGAPPEHRNFWPNEGKGVMIGNGAVIHGNVTIDSGIEASTKIGSDTFIMKNNHIGHDCIIEKKVTIAPHACIGGHGHIEEGANIGMGVIIHQRMRIGAYSMLGMGAIVTKKTPIWPYGKFVGNPARHLGRNRTGEHLTGYQYYQIEQEWKERY